MSFHKVVKNNAWVLGFTLRSRSDYEAPAQWDSARRQKYLLKPDVRHVLSFDDTVWPLCGTEQQARAIFAEPVSNGPEVDESCAYLTELFVLRAGQRDSPPDCVLVAAVGPCARGTLDQPIERAEEKFRSILKELEGSWRLLGFDVVEAYLGISGLSNTGYSENELASLQPRYTQLINEHGLLPDLVSAMDFARERTKQIIEHAPFLPVALFVLEDR